jgi:hypothetical protein
MGRAKVRVAIISGMVLVAGAVVAIGSWFGSGDLSLCEEWQEDWQSFLGRAGGRPELNEQLQQQRPEGCPFPSAVEDPYEVEGLFPVEAAYVATILHLQEIGDITESAKLMIQRDLTRTNDGPVLSDAAQRFLRSKLSNPEISFLRRSPGYTAEELKNLDATYIGVVRATEKPDGADAVFQVEVNSARRKLTYWVAVKIEDDMATIIQFDELPLG